MLSWITVGVLALSVLLSVGLPEYGLDAYHDSQWRGVFTTKNELGRVMLLGAVLWTVRGFAREIFPRRAVLVASAFAIVGFMSGARTALGVGALMVGVMVLIWLLDREGSSWVPIKGLVVSAIAVVGLVSFLKVEILLAIVGADYDLTGRTGIWEAVWISIAERPWLGTASTHSGWRRWSVRRVFRLVHTITPHSHNGFLDLVLALGVVGLVFYLVAMTVVLSRAVVNLHQSEGTSRTSRSPSAAS